MFSPKKLRSVLWLTLALAGCGGAAPESGLKLHPGTVASATSTFSFHTDSCVITDCAAEVRFAVDDPEIVVSAERNQDNCLPLGWTVRVADSAVATIAPAGTTPDIGLCQGRGAPARVKLTAHGAGKSRLEIVDDKGAVADAMPFAAEVAASVALHVAYKGAATMVALRPGDRVEVWTTLHDASGGELAASGNSRVWTVDRPGVSVLDVTADEHRALWPWLAADAVGDVSLHVATGPLQADIPVSVTR